MTTSSLTLMPQPFAWVDIPAGNVILTDTRYSGYLNKPTRFYVPAFQIAKYPTTNAQFDVFINHPDGYKNPAWWDFSEGAKQWRAKNIQPLDKSFTGDDHPRHNVTWYQSVAFSRWMSAITGEEIMLPTEQQWQRAAQGGDGREYPWGNKWDKKRCNNSVKNMIRMGNSKSTTPVTQYEGKGDSPYGVVDMSGNVWEWCLTAYETGNIDLIGTDFRMSRGGSWKDFDTVDFRASARNGGLSRSRNSSTGIRLVCS